MPERVFAAKLSKSRRITIPKVHIERLGLKPGDRLIVKIIGYGSDFEEAIMMAFGKAEEEVKRGGQA